MKPEDELHEDIRKVIDKVEEFESGFGLIRGMLNLLKPFQKREVKKEMISQIVDNFDESKIHMTAARRELEKALESYTRAINLRKTIEEGAEDE